MRLLRSMSALAVTASAGLLLAPGSAGGQGDAIDALEGIYQVRSEVHSAARLSQQKIDKLVDQTQSLLQQYRTEVEQVEALRIYNAQLEKLIEAQQAEKIKIRREIDSVTIIERSIWPLMQRMTDMLGQVVEADIPFLLAERQERVDNLGDLLTRSDVTVGEKYRLLIEAYAVENSYGHTIEAYQGELSVDGELRDVDFLRIGRVGLYYQTPDGDRSGAFDVESGEWIEIDSGYAGAIRQGLKVARRQAPPNLLLLPIQAAAAGAAQ